MSRVIPKIISGGQSGAERAALDWAIAEGVPHGGFCPKGGRADDGPIPADYGLRETELADGISGAERNVRDSDGTVIMTNVGTLCPESELAIRRAQKHGKPWMHVHCGTDGGAGPALLRFIKANGIRTLNVAGPRQSSEPAIDKAVHYFFRQAYPRPEGSDGPQDSWAWMFS